jgi:hypothetical protein
MKDGIEYILRFGNVEGTEEGSDEPKLNRYMLVTARLDDSKLPIPEMPEGLTAEDLKKPEETTEESETPADATQPPAEAEGEGTGAATSSYRETAEETFVALIDPQQAAGDAPQETPAAEDEPPAAEEAAAPEEAEATETEETPTTEPENSETPDATEAAPSTDPPPGGEEAAASTAEDSPAEETENGDAAPDAETGEPPAEEEAVDVVAQREQAAKEYQRKLDEWREKKDEAEKKVRELNARFADWYYVISEDVYKKLHLNRSDLIQVSESAKDEGFGLDAFRELESQGVETEETDESDDSDN